MKILILCTLILFLGACNKPDPHPEAGDNIFNDIQNEMAASSKQLEDAKKQLEDYKDQQAKVTPQNGQAAYFKKRVDEFANTVARLEQQKKFWIIHSDTRRDFVRKEYLKAFNKGKELDNKIEWEQYQAEKRLRQARSQWDARARREDFLKDLKKSRGPASGGEGGEGKPEGGDKPEHKE